MLQMWSFFRRGQLYKLLIDVTLFMELNLPASQFSFHQTQKRNYLVDPYIMFANQMGLLIKMLYDAHLFFYFFHEQS